MNVNVMAIFRQKIGDIYHFDLLAVHQNLQSFTVGWLVFNSKTDNLTYSTTGFLNETSWDITKLLEDVKKIIAMLERTFSDQ